MKPQEIEILTIVSDPFQENTYITHLGGSPGCVVIDPGLEPEKIVRKLIGRRLEPLAILNTHGHSDHIAGNTAMKEQWPDCPIMIGERDAPKLIDANLNLSGPYGFGLTSPKADRLLHDEDKLSLAGLDLRVRTIPGHTRGHVVYIVENCEPLRVFAGDVVFAGSIGRTDFPDGDHETLINGIRRKLLCLPDETILLSGHGPATTVGREKRSNPFLR